MYGGHFFMYNFFCNPNNHLAVFRFLMEMWMPKHDVSRF